MKVEIKQSEVRGTTVAPPSKSFTIRGAMCAALCSGESEIINPLISDDTRATAAVLQQIGVRIRQDGPRWHVTGGLFRQPEGELFCRESAATFRFMTAICTLVPGICRLTAGLSLARRPVKPLVETLRQLGADCTTDDDFAPVTIKGGVLRGGTAEIPGNISSQFISAVLLVSPLAGQGVRLHVTTPLESKPYVLMTTDCLEQFGLNVSFSSDLTSFEIRPQVYQPAIYKVEGDWSSVSYLLAAGALAGAVTVTNLNPASRQGDKVILDFLKDMGAVTEVTNSSITVKKSKLNAIKADLSDYTDLLPTMAVLAAAADGVSEFTGIARARLKESDRVSTVKQGLQNMGIWVEEDKDRLAISGGVNSPKASVDSHDDHRIAMAFGVLGLLTGRVTINGAECVTKTYPDFWDVLNTLGGEIKKYE